MECDFLLNSLEEDCKIEIFTLLDYDHHQQVPECLVKTIMNHLGEKETTLKHMMKILIMKDKTSVYKLAVMQVSKMNKNL